MVKSGSIDFTKVALSVIPICHYPEFRAGETSGWEVRSMCTVHGVGICHALTVQSAFRRCRAMAWQAMLSAAVQPE